MYSLVNTESKTEHSFDPGTVIVVSRAGARVFKFVGRVGKTATVGE